MKSLKQIFKNKIFIGLSIFLIILTIFISSGMIPEKKEASEEYCNSLISGYFTSATEVNTCLQVPGCYVRTTDPSNTIPILDDVSTCINRMFNLLDMGTKDSFICTSSIEDGQKVLEEPDACSALAIKQATWCGWDVYMCAPNEDGSTCNSIEKSFGFHHLTNDCKTNYYITIFGGFLLLIMIIAVI